MSIKLNSEMEKFSTHSYKDKNQINCSYRKNCLQILFCTHLHIHTNDGRLSWLLRLLCKVLPYLTGDCFKFVCFVLIFGLWSTTYAHASHQYTYKMQFNHPYFLFFDLIHTIPCSQDKALNKFWLLSLTTSIITMKKETL